MLTIKKVEKMKACGYAIEWAKPIWDGNKDTEINVLSRLISEDKLDWANWLIVRVMKRKQYLAYAIFSAEQVIAPDDKRPRQAIEAAKLVLKKDSKKNRASASAAAYDVAYAAAYAASSAAYDAAYASSAASAASAAACCAACSAASAAAKKEMQLKILNYGLSLLEGES
jgi:hypothetical protein